MRNLAAKLKNSKPKAMKPLLVKNTKPRLKFMARRLHRRETAILQILVKFVFLVESELASISIHFETERNKENVSSMTEE